MATVWLQLRRRVRAARRVNPLLARTPLIMFPIIFFVFSLYSLFPSFQAVCLLENSYKNTRTDVKVKLTLDLLLPLLLLLLSEQQHHRCGAMCGRSEAQVEKVKIEFRLVIRSITSRGSMKIFYTSRLEDDDDDDDDQFSLLLLRFLLKVLNKKPIPHHSTPT